MAYLGQDLGGALARGAAGAGDILEESSSRQAVVEQRELLRVSAL